MVYKKVCIICQKEFPSHQPSAKFCPDCHNRERAKYAQYKYLWKNNNRCNDCGKLISDKAKRCHSCGAIYLNKHHRGTNSPNWKGGKCYDSDGYIRVLNRSHPRAEKSGYVYQHILAWEEFNKMPLPENYIIHHLNGRKDDNRIRNLQALPRKGHHSALVQQALQKRIRELEAQLAQHKLC